MKKRGGDLMRWLLAVFLGTSLDQAQQKQTQTTPGTPKEKLLAIMRSEEMIEMFDAVSPLSLMSG
jgi:hypothetical protein